MANPRAWTWTSAIMAVNALGDCAVDIAFNLMRLGIKGRPASPRSCPITRYLTRIVPGPKWEVLSDTLSQRGTAIQVKLPRAVANFVEAFDNEEWKDLIAPKRTRRRRA